MCYLEHTVYCGAMVSLVLGDGRPPVLKVYADSAHGGDLRTGRPTGAARAEYVTRNARAMWDDYSGAQ